MTNSLITRGRDGAVAWLTLNHATRLNTLTAEMWRGLPSLLAVQLRPAGNTIKS